jgi:hypothetical protein
MKRGTHVIDGRENASVTSPVIAVLLRGADDGQHLEYRKREMTRLAGLTRGVVVIGAFVNFARKRFDLF